MKILDTGRENCGMGWGCAVSVILCLEEIMEGSLRVFSVVSQDRKPPVVVKSLQRDS